MMHKAWHSIEELPYCFSRSSIRFQGDMGWKSDDLNPNLRLLGQSQLSNPSDLPCNNQWFRLKFCWSESMPEAGIKVRGKQLHRRVSERNTYAVFFIYPSILVLKKIVHSVYIKLTDMSGNRQQHGNENYPAGDKPNWASLISSMLSTTAKIMVLKCNKMIKHSSL